MTSSDHMERPTIACSDAGYAAGGIGSQLESRIQGGRSWRSLLPSRFSRGIHDPATVWGEHGSALVSGCYEKWRNGTVHAPYPDVSVIRSRVGRQSAQRGARNIVNPQVVLSREREAGAIGRDADVPESAPRNTRQRQNSPFSTYGHNAQLTDATSRAGNINERAIAGYRQRRPPEAVTVFRAARG